MAPKDLTIAQRVIALRERLGLSQQQFADRSGALDRSYVAKIEIGDNKASSSKVRGALAKAAAVSLDAMGQYIEGTIELDALRLGELGSNVSSVPTAPSAQSEPPEANTPSIGVSLEESLGYAFDPRCHTLGDTRAVQGALGGMYQFEAGADALGAARAWLDAAASLRREGRTVTAVTLLTRVTQATMARSHQFDGARAADIERMGERGAREEGPTSLGTPSAAKIAAPRGAGLPAPADAPFALEESGPSGIRPMHPVNVPEPKRAKGR